MAVVRRPALSTDRVLNLLHYLKWYIDGTLSFRRSCAHGACGSDGIQSQADRAR